MNFFFWTNKKDSDRTKSNLATDVFAQWKWDDSQPIESLDALGKACVVLATDGIGWYNRKKNGKQWCAKLLRGSAIISSGVGGLLLICSQQKDGVSSGWAAAALIVAGTLVGLDRFFGTTDAWIRFVEASQEMRTLTHRFKIDWEHQKVSQTKEHLSPKQIDDAFLLARTFVEAIDAVVVEETDDWASQFRSNIVRHNAKVSAAAGGDAPEAGSSAGAQIGDGASGNRQELAPGSDQV